jgi:hypothetical protein
MILRLAIILEQKMANHKIKPPYTLPVISVLLVIFGALYGKYILLLIPVEEQMQCNFDSHPIHVLICCHSVGLYILDQPFFANTQSSNLSKNLQST